MSQRLETTWREAVTDGSCCPTEGGTIAGIDSIVWSRAAYSDANALVPKSGKSKFMISDEKTPESREVESHGKSLRSCPCNADGMRSRVSDKCVSNASVPSSGRSWICNVSD